jgi:cyclopropane fatty-acyl-phospholipid synthase-like methyltransferase
VDEPSRVVAAGYDAVAERYAALEPYEGAWPRLRRVAELARRLPAGGVVLDLGCGNGVPVARDLVAGGFRVTGVDLSEEQIRRARRNVPAATFMTADMLSVELPEGAFDAVVSLYAIDHVPRGRHLQAFRRIRAWLRPGGLALVPIEDADEPGDVHEWLGAPMFLSLYPAAEERRLAGRAGLEVLEAKVETQVEQGRDVAFLWLLLQRPDDDQMG